MKNKTGKLKLNKSMLVLAISLALAILISVGTVTYAVFTNSMHAQRTIAAYDNAGDRFSSNQLAKGFSKENVRTVYVTNAETTPSTLVTICNYDQGNPASPNTDQVSYSVTAHLVKYDGVSDYEEVTAGYMSSLTAYNVRISDGEHNVTLDSTNISDTSTFNSSLPKNTATSHQLTVTFSNNFASNQPNLYLELIVTGGGITLSGIFKTGLRAEGANVSWSGSFTDSTSFDPSDYDGYNYRIMGSGAGTYTLTWDSSKVALSYESKNMLLSIAGATSLTANSISFPVDSNEKNLYDVQFYKINIPNEISWVGMETSVVTGNFVES